MQLQEDRRNISSEPDRQADEQTKEGERKTCSCRKTDEIYQLSQTVRQTNRQRKGGKADSSADRDSKGSRQLFQAL